MKPPINPTGDGIVSLNRHPESSSSWSSSLVLDGLLVSCRALLLACAVAMGWLPAQSQPAAIPQPQAFTATGNLTSTEWHYYQVEIPAGSPGWRLVLNTTAGSSPQLYLRQGELPTTSAYSRVSGSTGNDTVILTETQATAGTWYVGVYQPSGSGSYALFSEVGYITTLVWDPGAHPDGTAIHVNSSLTGGDYVFRITVQNPAVGVWRTVLPVSAGEANVHLRPGGYVEHPGSYFHSSTRVGSDGLVLGSAQFTPGQDWTILVRATPGAAWSLFSGDVYVRDLGALAGDGSSGASATIRPEGIAYFRTTVPAATLAWRLWLQGGTNPIYVRKSFAPHPPQGQWDLNKNGAMLVVPPYLNAGTFDGSYFIGVPGAPGTVVNLDSRQHAVVDIPFDTAVAVNAGSEDFPYVTYRTQVPVQQIAWQINLRPSSGNPNLAVRRDQVPNEFRNDGFSEASGLVGDSVSLVPAHGASGITDGTYYLTVYGGGAFSGTLEQGPPEVTDVDYEFQTANDAPDRVGWRYYRVLDINAQLGSLGWELLLSGAPAGAEIALRRGALPGRWQYRNSDGPSAGSHIAISDYSSTTGFLQRPGHQADIWYIGVYHVGSALGEFELRGQVLDGSPVTLDGSSTPVAGHSANRWRFFKVEVPSDPDLLGWDVRLGSITGSPQMVVRRDLLPTNAGTTSSWGPSIRTNWPSGNQWAASAVDWTGYSQEPGGQTAVRVLTMGMGNPLEPGTYYVGVFASSGQAAGYTLRSRGIGTGKSIPIHDLAFGGTVTGEGLAPREVRYYRVEVPTGTESWKLTLRPTGGQALMVAHKGFIPNSGANSGGNLSNWSWTGSSYQSAPTGGRVQNTPGNEFLTVLPEYWASAQVPAGVYYVAVVGEGQNPGNGRIGSGAVAYTLENEANLMPTDLGTVGAVDLVEMRSLGHWDVALYEFDVPPGALSIEVRLENVVGWPRMGLRRTERLVAVEWNSCLGGAGSVGGEYGTWQSEGLITIASPEAGRYALTVGAADNRSTSPCSQPDASYTLRVRLTPVTDLSFSSELNTEEVAHSVSGVLADNQRAYYRVQVPEFLGELPVLGWDLNLVALNGTPSVRVRKGQPPMDGDANTSEFRTVSAMIAPPWLTPGTWYVEVKGQGNTTYTLISRALTAETLERPMWAMPALGEAFAAPGLSLPVFADTGTDAKGHALPGDRGVDLERGRFHYYAIEVPAGNAGLLRTELQAISGNSDLYLRAGGVPTLAHRTQGLSGSFLYDRSLTRSSNTEYGNWVPWNGRYESELTPGLWVLAVHAAGNSNVRYRLRLSCGNPVPGGLVQAIEPEGGVFANQNLAGRDWRYYRFEVPETGPAHWTVSFSRTLGGARLYFRDTMPPGDPATTYDQDYYGGGHQFQRDWYSDNKNQGPYPYLATPGTYTLTTPPLRPGSVYYVGVWSPDDTTFTLSVAPDLNGPAIPDATPLAFAGGQATGTLEGYGSALFVVDVPEEAIRWRHVGTHSSAVRVIIEQGTIPLAIGGAHWQSSGANSTLDWLLGASSWPFQPGHKYYVLVANTSAAAEPFTLSLQGVMANRPPLLVNPIPAQPAVYGVPCFWAIPPDTFADPDAGQSLSYSAGGLPGWLAFEALTRTFWGTPTAVGVFLITVTATDNGLPALSASTTFDLVVVPAIPVLAWASPAPILAGTPLSAAQLNATADVPGTFTYTPPAGTLLPRGPHVLAVEFMPQEAVNYTMAATTVGIEVLNNPPLAQAQSVTTPEDAPVAITLTGSDVDGDSLTYLLVSGPQHGVLTGGAPNLTYTPAAGFRGFDRFTFQVSDGQADSNPATVAITVLPAGEPAADLTVLHAFGEPSTSAGMPMGRVMEGSDGVLYGISHRGGRHNGGTVYRVHPDGSGFVVLRDLEPVSDGGLPYAGLIEGSDGVLYGTTSEGGVHDAGTIFRVQPDGSGFLILRHLNPAVDGSRMLGALLQGSDGVLYGTASAGGVLGNGTIFRLNRNGTGFAVLHHLQGFEGRAPSAALIEGSDGVLYGTIRESMASPEGKVFRLNKDGSGFAVVKPFTSLEGSHLSDAVVEGADGRLYGSGFLGGTQGDGTVWRMNRDGSGFAVLHHFVSGTDGRGVQGLQQGTDGWLYGTTLSSGPDSNGTAFRIHPAGGGFELLKAFGPAPDASYPAGGVIEGSDGVLYGLTSYGGSSNNGTLYRLNRDGSEFRIQWDFSYWAGGAYPNSGVIQASDHRLYGTVISGGESSRGMVFSLNADGTDFQILRSLADSPDGANPFGPLIEGSDGLLYGTTGNGGTAGMGTVFRLKRNGTDYVVLKSFDGSTEGGTPFSRVLEGTDGILYGTTYGGGSHGGGTVWRMNHDGTGFGVLRHLEPDTDGLGQMGGLTEGWDGWLYGTAPLGGGHGQGTIFRLSRDGGVFQVLRHLNGTAEGAHPYSRLLGASNGLLYGTTEAGGTYGGGTIYRIASDGTGFAVLRHLNPPADGEYVDTVMEGPDGFLYGCTSGAGEYGVGTLVRYGTLFRLRKDGAGFETLRYLGLAATEPRYPWGRFTLGRDGRFYATSYQGGSTDSGTVYAFSVVPANYAPTVILLSHQAVPENQPVGTVVGLLTAEDPDTGDTHTFELVAGEGDTDNALFGIVGNELRTAAVFDYEAQNQYSIRVRATDASGLFVEAVWSVGILDVNEAPVAFSQSVVTARNTPVAITLAGEDVEGDALTYTVVSGPEHGSLTGTAPHLTYTPAAGYLGSDEFTFVVSDGLLTSTPATVTIEVQGWSFTALSLPATATSEDPHNRYAYPYGGLIELDGRLYGTASGWGSSQDPGSVFRVNAADGSIETVHTFTGLDGANPFAPLTASGGMLYGTTANGGTNPDGSWAGGTLFRIAPVSGTQTVLHTFTADAVQPHGRVVELGGSLYGTTVFSSVFGGPGGTLYRCDLASGEFTVLHQFKGPDGAGPYAGLSESGGQLYGTTIEGGLHGVGTLFRFDPATDEFEVLHHFEPAEGAYPADMSLLVWRGKLYGTTWEGGAHNIGVAYSFDLAERTYSVLHSFSTEEGEWPSSALLPVGARLYGTTYQGGEHGDGTVYRLDPETGAVTVLHHFNGADGRWASGMLARIGSTIYGTAFRGGADDLGTVFQIQLLHDAPVADDQSLETYDSQPLPITLTGLDLESEELAFRVVSGPVRGTLQGTPPSLIYIPPFPFTGTDSFIFEVEDEDGGTATGTVAISILPSDRPPVAVAGDDQQVVAGTDCQAVVTVDGSASSDPDGDPIRFAWELFEDGELLDSVAGEAAVSWALPIGTYQARLTVFTDVAGSVAAASDTLMIQVLPSAPILVALTPAAAHANGPAFELTVSGGCFLEGATVYWNGAPRPTTWVGPNELWAAIPAFDLQTGVDIFVAPVQVVNSDGQVSNPLGFSVVVQSVGTVDATVSQPGETTTVSTAPQTAGEPGATVTVENAGDQPVTVLSASYGERPVGETVFQVDNGSFVDVQIVGDAETLQNVSATVFFYYPSNVTGGMENRVKLRYFNGVNWIPVLSSGGLPPAKNTTDNLDGTISGGRFTVIFDLTSTPTILELGGTVFGMFESQPQLQAVHGPEGPVALGQPIEVSVAFAVLGDPDAVQVHFEWNDGTVSTVIPVLAGGAGYASATHLYGGPGVYPVIVRVVDAEGDEQSGRFEYAVIYDPNGGFVTGGGWIQSPPGAYEFDPTLAGRATFGFVSKYGKGKQVPTGDTQFQFQAAEFRFHSTAYEWLVVSGAKAQYKGVGKVNHAGDYGFLLTATDGQVKGGGGTDRFRIKIWDRASGVVVYDNALGAPDDLNQANPQAIGGGNIVIHPAK